MRETFEDLKNIYKEFGTNIYKTQIDSVNVIAYICNSLMDKLKINSKFLFMKQFNVDIKEIVELPPIIDKEKYETLTLSRFILKYQDDILKFTKVLEEKFTKEDLLLLHKNIKTLHLKLVDSLKSNGYYDPYENLIVVRKDRYNNTLPHELFHMASSKNFVNDSVCGFHYISKGFSIGRALNEGYTTIMADRYFETGISSSAYQREVNYFDVIEDVIGEKELEKLYMNANLSGLIKKLSKYKKEKDVINFIMKTDEILRKDVEPKTEKPSKYEIIKMHDYTNQIIEVNLFLASLNFNKNNMNDLTTNITNYDNYSNLYRINENYDYKNIYVKSLIMYNMKKKETSAMLQELYEVIGYDKLERVCFENGIYGIINELIKYTSLDEIYRYLELLNKYLTPYKSFDENEYNKLNNFIFSIKVSKSRILDDIEPSIDSGFNLNNYDKDLFMPYRVIIESLIKHNPSNIFGENSNFDDDDVCRLYELVGKENMLRLYINGDVEGLFNILKQYGDTENIMRLIDSDNEELKEFFDKNMKNENNRTI